MRWSIARCDDGGEQESLLHVTYFTLEFRDICDFNFHSLSWRDIANLCHSNTEAQRLTEEGSKRYIHKLFKECHIEM